MWNNISFAGSSQWKPQPCYVFICAPLRTHTTKNAHFGCIATMKTHKTTRKPILCLFCFRVYHVNVDCICGLHTLLWGFWQDDIINKRQVCYGTTAYIIKCVFYHQIDNLGTFRLVCLGFSCVNFCVVVHVNLLQILTCGLCGGKGRFI